MPRLLGLNLLAVVVASVAFYFVGFAWYGVLFREPWLAAEGLSAEAAEAAGGPSWFFAGFVITMLQAIGVGLVLKWRGAASPQGALASAAALWAVFALPVTSYAYIYGTEHNTALWMIDAGHLLVGWLACALAYAFIR